MKGRQVLALLLVVCVVAVAEVETITLPMLAASWPKHCQVPWTPDLQLLRAGTCLVSGAQKQTFCLPDRIRVRCIGMAIY